MDCRFCSILEREPERVIREMHYTISTLSDPKLMPGHALVIPKRHVEKLSELSNDERDELLEETVRLQEKILTEISPGCDISQHYRPFIPNNSLKVSHVHMHVRPRNLDDELYTRVQIHENEMFQHVSDKEAATYVKLLAP